MLQRGRRELCTLVVMGVTRMRISADLCGTIRKRNADLGIAKCTLYVQVLPRCSPHVLAMALVKTVVSVEEAVSILREKKIDCLSEAPFRPKANQCFLIDAQSRSKAGESTVTGSVSVCVCVCVCACVCGQKHNCH